MPKMNVCFKKYMDALIEIHDQIKAHPFRKEFSNQYNIGTFKSLCKEYMSLIYQTTEIICAIGYCCKDNNSITSGDCFWIHDFRSFLFNIDLIYIKEPKFIDEKKVQGLDITPREVYSKTGLTDIGTVMIFLDKYIGYIHQFIETESFTRITSIKYELCTNPHNGYYYKHMVECEKTKDGWRIVELPEFIGTKQISKE